MVSQGVVLGFVQKVGGVILSLILVRILAKEDFGAFNIASAAIVFLMTFSVQNFAEHSFFTGRDGNPGFDRHLGFALILHGAIGLLILGIAGIATTYPDYAPAAPLLAFGALAPMLNAPRIIYTVSLSRDLEWKRIRLLGVASFAFAACGTLFFAFAGQGGLALMCQIVLVPVPYLVDMALKRRDLFAVSTNLRGYRESFTFGGLRSAGGAMGQGRPFVESLLVGGAFGLETLGVFGRAFALAQLTTGWLSSQLASITYPILAKFEPRTDDYQRASGLIFRFSCWTVLPPAVAVGFADEAAIAVIYGERWLEATPFFRPMTLTVLSLTIMSCLNVIALGAIGARFVFLNQTAVFLLGLSGLALAMPVSLFAYAWFLAIALFGLMAGMLAFLIRAKALSLSAVMRVVTPCAALVALAVVLDLSVYRALISMLPHWVELIAASAASALAMIILIRMLDSDGLAEATRFAPEGMQPLIKQLMMLKGAGASNPASDSLA
jgi:O-antigen/teichoic acid export membrane protein